MKIYGFRGKNVMYIGSLNDERLNFASIPLFSEVLREAAQKNLLLMTGTLRGGGGVKGRPFWKKLF